MGHAVLRDDVLDHVACRHYTGSGCQQRLDFRLAFRGHRRHGDEGLAALGERASVHEVVLAADARDDAYADRIGADLSREVDLHGRVDGHDLRILTDAERIVGPRHILQHQILAVIHVVVQAARPEGQRRHRDPGHDDLLRVVDHAALQQRQYAVGHRFGMESEVFVIFQRSQHGIRDSADADLQRGAVGDHLGDVAPDAELGLGRHGRRNLDQRRIDLHGCGEARRVDDGIAVGEGHGTVDLCDDDPGALHGRNRQVGRDAERAVTFGIRGRNVDQCHVQWNRAVAEQPRDLAQEGRNRLSVSVGEPAADVVGDEEAVDEERFAEFGTAVGSVVSPHGEGRVELHAVQLPAAFGQGGNQHFGNRRAALNVDALA